VNLAGIFTILGLAVAVASALYAWREWRHKTRHWLCIPPPDGAQNPLEPEFWVFPPVELEQGHVAVPIGGILRNVGPSPAFSVRIYADPEYSGEAAMEALRETFHLVLAKRGAGVSSEDLWRSFVKHHRTRSSYSPMLAIGEELRFLVVAKFEADDPFVLQFSDQEKVREEAGIAPWDRSYRWTLDELQAHRVHAASRTFTRRRLEFAPGDLCAPMESEAELRRWATPPVAGSGREA
jgi:hypothetical protein